MRKGIRSLTFAASACATVAIFAACGGGGGGGDNGGGGGVTPTNPIATTPAAVTVSGVQKTLVDANKFVPSCTATGVAKMLPGNAEFAAVMKAIKLTKAALDKPKSVGKTVALISSTAPQQMTGDCGGTVTFPTWSHASGTTSIAVNFANYCTRDSITGETTTINGSLSAVDNGTPTNSGPVTSSITANIPALTVVEKNSAGTIIAQDSISLTGFKYVPATGASASLSDLPGTFTLTSVAVNDDKNKKSIKMDNVSVTTTVSGANTQVAMTGRFYSGKSGYTDVATSNLVFDANQVATSGNVTFTGAGGSKATLTVNPSPGTGKSSFSMDVGGAPAGTMTCDGIEIL